MVARSCGSGSPGPTVRDHETPLEAASYYVRRPPRRTGQRWQIDMGSARRFLLCAGFAETLHCP
jgi:hypothetical protein